MATVPYATICDNCGSRGQEYLTHVIPCCHCEADVCADCCVTFDPDPPGHALCKLCEKENAVILEWKLVCGEWVFTAHRRAHNSTGYMRIASYTLSPHGPPFKYRQWHRQWKDWQRFTLDHCSTIEEAKACLALMVRLS